jgi:hypothetical protein
VKMGAPMHRVARDLMGLTLLGQVADRFGAIAGPLAAIPFVILLHPKPRESLGLSFSIGFALNFILAGLAIGLLVRWYMRRWSLSGRRVAVMALVAGALTNPMWLAAAMTVVPNPDYGQAPKYSEVSR